MLSVFLRQLEQELTRRMPPLEAQAALDEARDHLEASLQARLELGMTPEEAERETVAAFGAAGLMVDTEDRASKRQHRIRNVCQAIWWGAIVIAILAAGFSTQSLATGFDLAYGALFCAIAVAFGLASFRLRRPNPLALARPTLLGVLCLSIAMTASYVVYPEGDSIQLAQRNQVGSILAELSASERLDREGRLAGRIQRPDRIDYAGQRASLIQAMERPATTILPTANLALRGAAMASVPPFALDLVFGGLGMLVRRRTRSRPRAIG